MDARPAVDGGPGFLDHAPPEGARVTHPIVSTKAVNLPVFTPGVDWGELSPNVALLKAVLGFDEHTRQFRKPAPPKPFGSDLIGYILFGLEPRQRQRTRKPCRPTLAPPPPDSLLTPAEAARMLRISEKTLHAHVAAGVVGDVSTGHGRKRQRIRFSRADLDNFIANQTRKDVPCPSTKTETVARRTGTSTSKCEVIGFTARRNARRAAKPKK